MSHTYVLLDVTQAAYDEIATKLQGAGYAPAFHRERAGAVIDMHGIAVRGPRVQHATHTQEEEGMSVGTQVQLPRWECHTQVRADRIRAVIVLSPLDERTPPTNHDVTILLDGGGEIGVSKTFVARGIPSPGDYFVQDDDGSRSWFRAKAFEGEYTRLGS